MPVIEAPPPPILHGDIVCEIINGKSVLTKCYARSPLKLLTPRSHDRAARVVTSTFGGGLVSGDAIEMRLAIEPGAACVMTTQSAGKVYRSIGATCRQTTNATVDEDGLLIVAPDPLYCFADAKYEQRQRFDLSATGNLIWLDILTSGRRARGESWAFDSFTTRTDVFVDEKLRIREATRLCRDGDESITDRLGGFACYAVVLMVGPALGKACEATRAVARDLPFSRSADLLATASTVEEGVIIRVLGRETESVLQLVHRLLSGLVPLIGGDPLARKW